MTALVVGGASGIGAAVVERARGAGARVGHSGTLLDIGADEWDRVIAVNTRGPWLAMRALAAAMIAETIAALHSMTWVTGQIVDCDGGLSLHSPIDSFGEHQ